MIFARMIKADAAQRIVQARLDETPDRSNMIMDYASSKPEFEAWSETMRKASDGKSYGNVRAMHQLVAAGKVEAISFDDAAKSIDFMIKVVDDATWGMIEEGVYTGISQGGMYKRRWSDGRFTRYTALPNEISIVDIPCKPEATFTMVKADGAEEARAFKPGDSLGQLSTTLLAAQSVADYRGILLAQSAPMLKALFATDEMRAIAEAQQMRKKDYSGDEREAMAKKGQAMPDGSYPIADTEDLKNAIQAHGRAKDKEAVKAHITKRAKALKATDELPEDWEGSTKNKAPMKKTELPGFMRKGLGEVARLAGLLDGLTWLASCVAGEAAAERDGSPLPEKLAAWLQQGSEILTAMATEETQEAVSALNTAVSAIPGEMRKAAIAGDMLKVGARHSKADMERIQSIHDHTAALGADCGTMEKASGAGDMLKAAFELANTRERMAKLEGENNDLKKRVAELERQPAAGGPVLRRAGIDRAADTGGTAPDAAAPAPPKEVVEMPNGPDKALHLIRHAMEHPEPPSAPRRRG